MKPSSPAARVAFDLALWIGAILLVVVLAVIAVGVALDRAAA